MPTRRPVRVRWLDHTADAGMEVLGDTPAAVYEAAVLGTAALIAGDSPVRETEERTLEVRGADRVERLVCLAGEVIYLYDTERFLPAWVEAVEEGDAVRATVRGEPFSAERHAAEREVKAATWHAAAFERREGGGWVGRVVFDL